MMHKWTLRRLIQWISHFLILNAKICIIIIHNSWFLLIVMVIFNHNYLHFLLMTVTKEGLNKLLKTIKMVYESYTKRIPTSALNAAIERMMFVTPTPTVRGKKVKLFYGTQVDIKPPTFLFFSNFPQLIPESYKRNIKSTIRNSIYQFPGSPLFLKFKARG